MRHRSLSLFAALAVLVVAACAPPPVAKSGTAEDEAAIRAMGDKYAAAFNARDAKALGALSSSDYEEFNTMGQHVVGRDSLMAGMTAMWPQMPPDMKMTKASTEFVKWIDATHAVAGGAYEMSGVPAGMPNHGAWMGVMVKVDSNWMMMSSLAGDAPPAPPAAGGAPAGTGAPPVIPTKPPKP